MSSTVSPPTFSPPLLRALPYAKYAVSALAVSSLALFHASFTALATLTRPLAFLSPLPFLLYVLAPAIVFVQIFVEVGVYNPYRAVVFLLDTLYPVYVCIGVACITGALLGLGGRLTVLGLVSVLAPSHPPPTRNRVLRDPLEEVKARWIT
ncbi:hypothetical protein B0H15DRAFT_409933 [Mycena belliarum]|uniref:Uncharacterized protein n=1 Tax=Mycena belliarum TaxID=1033014 RepID=A0AAD6UGA1_9AGAR|nr:hypothetical protein B0H15DRAFT_409933 [Mycena belliae]